jgi:glycosyltransferase involved in cell wall biosynthesis
LPVRNRAAWIARAVESVLLQTYRPLELIVVDDGSTDSTLQVLRQFGSQISVLSQPPAGAYAARNAGLARARGEFVAFIDSDDAWLPSRLSVQMPLMSRPEVGLVFGDAHLVRPAGDAFARTGGRCAQITPPHRGRVAAQFIWGNFVPTVTVLARRRCFDEVGGFAPVALSADYLKWFQIASRCELDYVAEPIAEYTVHSDGISANLGETLRTRIQVFSDELSYTTDADTRAMLRRLLFNLSLHLGLAAVRGRAGRRSHAVKSASHLARSVGGFDASLWIAAFVYHQVQLRTSRLIMRSPVH